jgi:hypothetical protein
VDAYERDPANDDEKTATKGARETPSDLLMLRQFLASDIASGATPNAVTTEVASVVTSITKEHANANNDWTLAIHGGVVLRDRVVAARTPAEQRAVVLGIELAMPDHDAKKIFKALQRYYKETTFLQANGTLFSVLQTKLMALDGWIDGQPDKETAEQGVKCVGLLLAKGSGFAKLAPSEQGHLLDLIGGLGDAAQNARIRLLDTLRPTGKIFTIGGLRTFLASEANEQALVRDDGPSIGAMVAEIVKDNPGVSPNPFLVAIRGGARLRDLVLAAQSPERKAAAQAELKGAMPGLDLGYLVDQLQQVYGDDLLRNASETTFQQLQSKRDALEEWMQQPGVPASRQRLFGRAFDQLNAHDQQRLQTLLIGRSEIAQNAQAALLREFFSGSGEAKAVSANALHAFLQSYPRSNGAIGFADGMFDHNRVPYSWSKEDGAHEAVFEGQTEPKSALEYCVHINGQRIFVNIPVPAPLNTPSIDEIARTLAVMPATSRSLIWRVVVQPKRKGDSFMSSSATGEVNIYPTDANQSSGYRDGAAIHESGHVISQRLWGSIPGTREWKLWRDAMASDSLFVSSYARHSKAGPQDDFAETLEAYIRYKGTPLFEEVRARFPARFAMIEKILAGDIEAPAQTAIEHVFSQKPLPANLSALFAPEIAPEDRGDAAIGNLAALDAYRDPGLRALVSSTNTAQGWGIVLAAARRGIMDRAPELNANQVEQRANAFFGSLKSMVGDASEAQEVSRLMVRPEFAKLTAEEQKRLLSLVRGTSEIAGSARSALNAVLSAPEMANAPLDGWVQMLKGFVKDYPYADSPLHWSPDAFDAHRVAVDKIGDGECVEYNFTNGGLTAALEYKVTIEGQDFVIRLPEKPNSKNGHYPTAQDVARSLAALPKAQRRLIREVNVNPGPRSYDDDPTSDSDGVASDEQPAPAKTKAAPAPASSDSPSIGGVVDLSPRTEPLDQAAFDEQFFLEAGQALAGRTLGDHVAAWEEWQSAMAHDPFVMAATARRDLNMDFALSFSAYVRYRDTPQADEVRARYPERWKILDKLVARNPTQELHEAVNGIFSEKPAPAYLNTLLAPANDQSTAADANAIGAAAAANRAMVSDERVLALVSPLGSEASDAAIAELREHIAALVPGLSAEQAAARAKGFVDVLTRTAEVMASDDFKKMSAADRERWLRVVGGSSTIAMIASETYDALLAMLDEEQASATTRAEKIHDFITHYPSDLVSFQAPEHAFDAPTTTDIQLSSEPRRATYVFPGGGKTTILEATVTIDGHTVQFRFPDQEARGNFVAFADAADALLSVPKSERALIKEVNINPKPDPKQPDLTIGGANGVVQIYPGRILQDDLRAFLIGRAGQTLAEQLFGEGNQSEVAQKWSAAAAADPFAVSG